jgi:cysteinyl-tRNA synthetase
MVSTGPAPRGGVWEFCSQAFRVRDIRRAGTGRSTRAELADRRSAEADAMRTDLAARGVTLEDTPAGGVGTIR